MLVLRHSAAAAVGQGPASASWWCSSSAVRQPTTCSASNRRKRAKRPGNFEVKEISPPTRSLGVHALPPDTHNGDVIEVAGTDFVVDAVVIQYKLVKGRYERAHHRLDVWSTSRYLLNRNLESALSSSSSNK